MRGTRLTGRKRIDEIYWHDIYETPGVYIL